MNTSISVPKKLIEILDQVFEIEKKLESIKERNSLERNINRIKEIFEYINSDAGIIYHNPIGEKYSENRTDLEASIAGNSIDDLVITEVIKPIIRVKTSSGLTTIIRKGVVVVETNKL